MCGCLPCTHHQGPGLQPRHVPWLGIKPATIWFAGQHSVHWATPPRTLMKFFKGKIYIRWNPWKCKYIIRSVLTNVNTCVANTPIKGQNISITLQSFIILPSTQSPLSYRQPVFSFLSSHINSTCYWLIQYVLFYVWILLFNMKFLILIHIDVYISINPSLLIHV